MSREPGNRSQGVISAEALQHSRTAGYPGIDIVVHGAPDRQGAPQDSVPGIGEEQAAGTSVVGVRNYLDIPFDISSEN